VVAFAVIGLVWSSNAFAQSGAMIADGGFVYTANELDNSMSRIELSTGDVQSIPLPIEPHNVQVTAHGTLVLVVGAPTGPHKGQNAGMSDMSGMQRGALLIFETATLQAGPVAEIQVGMHPAHVIADPDGEFAYVTNSGDDNVAVIDISARAARGTISTGAFPHGFRMSPLTREMYVADVDAGAVSVLDAASMTELTRILVGDGPLQVGFTPDGERAYVSLRDENKVAVIDTASRTVIGKIEVGRAPVQVYVTPNGKEVLVANQGTEEQPDNHLSVIDVASGVVTETIQTGAGAHGVVVSDDGTLAFVTNAFADTVSVIRVENGKVIATIGVGRRPNGISYQSQ
jgi:YVTN family beta-propeller protein